MAGTSKALYGYKTAPGSVSVSVGGVNIRKGMSDAEVLEQLRDRQPISQTADMQYKIETLPNGMKYVQADRQVITGDTPKEQAKNLEDYINNEIRHGRDVVIPTEDGDYLKITEDTAWKIGDPNTISDVKANAGTHVDELAAVSKYRRPGKVGDRTGKRFQPDDFEIRRAYFRDYSKDGKPGDYYAIDISVGVDKSGKTFYSIAKPEKKTAPPTPGSSSNVGGALQDGQLPYTNNTIGADESQGEFAYKDADVPNTPLADALGNIDINSIYKNGRNDAGDEWQAARQPLSQPTADSSPYTGEPMELKGRGEFGSDEAYAHYLIDVGQKELAKVPKITRAFLEAIARRTGLKIVIGDTGAITGQKSAGGYSRSRDVLVLDYDTVQSPEKLARAVINHELVHATETSMFYKSLEKHAFEQMFGGDEKALSEAIKKKQHRYAKSGVKLGEKGAKAELVASYIGESILTSEEAINRLVIEKPTLAMQIREALVKAYDKVKTYFTDRENYDAKYVISDLEKGIKLFEKALYTRRNFKDFVKRLSGNVDGDVQYDINKPFSEQVHETLYGNINDRNHVYVGETTSILKQAGLNDKPMLITKGHLRDINHPKDGKNSKYHGLTEKMINELPKILDYPAIIFDSISPNNSEAVCILSEKLDGDGNPILVAIKPDGKGRYNNVEIDSNFILSMYGKGGIKSFIRDLNTNSGNVIFMDNKRTQALLKAAGLQLPAELSNLKFNTILHQSKNVVNGFYDINLEVSDAIEVPDIRKDASLQLPLTSKKMIPQAKPIVKSQMQEALEKAGLNDFQNSTPVAEIQKDDEVYLTDEQDYNRRLYFLKSIDEFTKRMKDEGFPDYYIDKVYNQLNYAMMCAYEGDYSVFTDVLPML